MRPGAERAKLASLDPVTGVPDSYLTLGLTGFYPGRTNPTRAHNFTSAIPATGYW